jgi:hypothetical protein
MVNLKALEAAIQKVEKVREHELEFQAGDTRVTLRPLRPFEETQVQKWASAAWDDADPEGDNPALASYLDRLRIGMLAFSIVEIDGIDLRDVEFLENGEIDENGNSVEVLKSEVVRDIIAKDWGRQMLTEVYAQYSALTDRVEARASANVQYDPADLDDEIERLEKRLSKLRAKKEEKKHKPGPSPDRMAQEQKATSVVNEQQRRRGRVPSQESEGTSQDGEAPSHPSVGEERVSQQEQPEPQVAQGRRSAVPDNVPAHGREEVPQQPEQEQERHVRPEDAHGIPEPHGGDSFFDPADPDSDDALEAESRRQAALMRQHLERKKANEEETRRREEAGLPTGPVRPPQAASGQTPRAAARVDPRTGGLRSAANASDAVFSGRPDQVTTARPARPSPATLGGKPVYKMPTQTLDRPQRQRPRDAGAPPSQEAPTRSDEVQLNPEGGSRNPRFRGPEES